MSRKLRDLSGTARCIDCKAEAEYPGGVIGTPLVIRHDPACPTDDRLDLEFAYTSWADSCQETYGVDRTSSVIQCRRPAGHGQAHAAGFGRGRIRWGGR